MPEAATDRYPPGAPVRPWRRVARLLLVDERGRLLVQRACEPDRPERGQWWEVPGGGIEPGEDSTAAAVRELAEETGYVVAPEQVGPVCWTCDVMFVWGGIERWASMVLHLARVDGSARPVSPTAHTPEEVGSFLGTSWVWPDDLDAGSDRMPTFPPGLPADLPRLLSGEPVRAGFRVWR